MSARVIASGLTADRTFAFPDANGTILTSLTTSITLAQTALGAVSTDGLVLQNTTASTSGVTVQISPRSLWRGTAWDTAASETVDFFAEVLPATGASPTGSWRLGYSLNGAAAAYPFTITSLGSITLAGTGNITVPSAASFAFTGRGFYSTPSDGIHLFTNGAFTIGSRLKVDALPTVASGFGTSPSITAGSTPFAGSVNVGTGGVATSGVVNFNGTAFASAPFVVCMNTTTGAVVRATATTTQLTITAPSAFVASDVIAWICVSSK